MVKRQVWSVLVSLVTSPETLKAFLTFESNSDSTDLSKLVDSRNPYKILYVLHLIEFLVPDRPSLQTVRVVYKDGEEVPEAIPIGPANKPVDHVAQNPDGLSVQGEKIDIQPGVVPPAPPLPSNMKNPIPPVTPAEPMEDKENVGTYPPTKPKTEEEAKKALPAAAQTKKTPDNFEYIHYNNYEIFRSFLAPILSEEQLEEAMSVLNGQAQHSKWVNKFLGTGGFMFLINCFRMYRDAINFKSQVSAEGLNDFEKYLLHSIVRNLRYLILSAETANDDGLSSKLDLIKQKSETDEPEETKAEDIQER